MKWRRFPYHGNYRDDFERFLDSQTQISAKDEISEMLRPHAARKIGYNHLNHIINTGAL